MDERNIGQVRKVKGEKEGSRTESGHGLMTALATSSKVLPASTKQEATITYSVSNLDFHSWAGSREHCRAVFCLCQGSSSRLALTTCVILEYMQFLLNLPHRKGVKVQEFPNTR